MNNMVYEDEYKTTAAAQRLPVVWRTWQQ